MTITHEAVKEMISELRRMSNRTGNKQAERAMRDGATWLEDVERNRAELQNENENLRKKLSDKDEQLAGWKSLVDGIKSVQSAQPPEPTASSSTNRAERYDYAGAIADFMASGEVSRKIPVLKHYANGYIPSAYRLNKVAKAKKFPVVAIYRKDEDVVMLCRTEGVAE